MSRHPDPERPRELDEPEQDLFRLAARNLAKRAETAEAKLARITALDAEQIINERSLAEGGQRLYAIQVAEVALSYVRAILNADA